MLAVVKPNPLLQ